jgi:hypothetical protein
VGEDVATGMGLRGRGRGKGYGLGKRRRGRIQLGIVDLWSGTTDAGRSWVRRWWRRGVIFLSACRWRCSEEGEVLVLLFQGRFLFVVSTSAITPACDVFGS